MKFGISTFWILAPKSGFRRDLSANQDSRDGFGRPAVRARNGYYATALSRSNRSGRTLQKPSISTPAETDPCFVGVLIPRINAMRSYVTENKT